MLGIGGIIGPEEKIGRNVQGGSNMTGTDVARFTHKSVPVIFEPPCILGLGGISGACREVW